MSRRTGERALTALLPAAVHPARQRKQLTHPNRLVLRERRLDADENKGRPDLAILCGQEPVGQDR
jgi:hypothetical protein